MKITPQFEAKVEDGKLVFSEYVKIRMKEYLQGLIGKKIVFSIKEHKNTRSDRQNRYYWGVVLQMLSEETGHKAEELHEIFKEKFGLKNEIYLSNKQNEMEIANITISTTKYNTAQFEEYLEKIRRWSAEFYELYIPLPNEVDLSQVEYY